MIKNANKRVFKYNFIIYNDIYWNWSNDCELWSGIMNKTLHTKFGTAKLRNDGYYVISSRKEGNHNKMLHRLIWEDFYGCEVPEGYVIHHKNEDKLCNCVLNLQLMRESEHKSLHNKGKILSNEHKQKISENSARYWKGKNLSDKTKMKMSEAQKGKSLSDEYKLKISKTKNTSGYYRVSKQKYGTCKQGFIWRYSYYVDGKQKSIKSIDINDLESKVKAKGLIWKKLKGDE